MNSRNSFRIRTWSKIKEEPEVLEFNSDDIIPEEFTSAFNIAFGPNNYRYIRDLIEQYIIPNEISIGSITLIPKISELALKKRIIELKTETFLACAMYNADEVSMTYLTTTAILPDHVICDRSKEAIMEAVDSYPWMFAAIEHDGGGKYPDTGDLTYVCKTANANTYMNDNVYMNINFFDGNMDAVLRDLKINRNMF